MCPVHTETHVMTRTLLFIHASRGQNQTGCDERQQCRPYGVRHPAHFGDAVRQRGGGCCILQSLGRCDDAAWRQTLVSLRKKCLCMASVPGRKPPCCIPPNISGFFRMDGKRHTKMPTPSGPWNLCADKERRSTCDSGPVEPMSMGTCPGACTASV